MAKYLLIESRDCFESSDQSYWQMASDLQKAGNEVTLFLVQNGVLPARRGPKSAELTTLSEAGVTIMADEFSLRERGIDSSRLSEVVQASPLDLVIDQMAEGTKTIWH
jgi:predicted peroxiredoxin